MAGMSGVNSPSNLQIEFVRTAEGAPCLEIEARMPSEIKAISPLVRETVADRKIMRRIAERFEKFGGMTPEFDFADGAAWHLSRSVPMIT
jgi:hypothetical protein